MSRLVLPTDLLPPTVARRVRGSSTFTDDVTRYVIMTDQELVAATENCLRNLSRLDESDGTATWDIHLRLVLVPELVDRIVAGTRDRLRQISSGLAEYIGPGFFGRLLSPESRDRLLAGATALRADIARAAKLETEELLEWLRFAIAGSRAARYFSPDDCVYEPAFTYRLVPVIAARAAAMRSTT